MADKPGHETARQFVKQQQAQDAKKATIEYEAEAAALRAKTERLKALRLARDAAAPQAATAKRKPKTSSKTKSNGGKLSDWLDGQAKEGRNR